MKLLVTSFIDRIQLQLLVGINVLCAELGIMGPNPFECRSTPWYRNLDGSCNNLVHPAWGKASYPIRREFPADYDDSKFFAIKLQGSGSVGC